ncbi:hypothetical protein ONZ45_g18244 [Pleurotus djamor]|nr:hypothetical protein ONZ45_g18244 [Pleurotus djamor]
MTLTIKFGREKLSIDISPATASLSDLRHAIAEKTHLPLNSFKLIHAGAVMKDDALKLSAYKIHEKSALVLIPSSPPPQPTTAAIMAELTRVRTQLKPAVATFIKGEAADPKKEHARLSELLLQSLLALDGLDTVKMTDETRMERKAAVNEVQDLLDQVDQAGREKAPKS